jgi:hypothetical protein
MAGGMSTGDTEKIDRRYSGTSVCGEHVDTNAM